LWERVRVRGAEVTLTPPLPSRERRSGKDLWLRHFSSSFAIKKLRCEIKL